MSEPRALPIVVVLPPGANEAAERAAREEREARWEVEQAALCSEFIRTGRHRLEPESAPSFFCGPDPWAGHVLRCVGNRTRVTRIGQMTFACVVFRVPGERRGTRGQKNLDRLEGEK